MDLVVRADITDSLTDSWITEWTSAQEDFHPRGEGLSRDDEEGRKAKEEVLHS